MQFLYIDILPNKNIFHSILCTYTFLYAVFSTTKTKSFTLREKPKFTPPPSRFLATQLLSDQYNLAWVVMGYEGRCQDRLILDQGHTCRSIVMGEDGCSIPSSPIDFDISSFFFFFSLHQSTVLCFYLLRLPPYFQLYYSPLKYQYVIIENEC